MKKILVATLTILSIMFTSSCRIISDDEFIYLGHGADSPDNHLYYNSTKKLFILIDKHNGCFQKDDTGTCLAFTEDQTKEFRNKVLSRMIDIDKNLAKQALENCNADYLEEAGITTTSKSINIGDIYATPVRKIYINRKPEYSLMKNSYKVYAKVTAMAVINARNEKQLKVIYSISIPEVSDIHDTNLRPLIVDPVHLYGNMTMKAVSIAKKIQLGIFENQKKAELDVYKHLENAIKQTDPSEDV